MSEVKILTLENGVPKQKTAEDNLATTANAGFLSAADKSKIDILNLDLNQVEGALATFDTQSGKLVLKSAASTTTLDAGSPATSYTNKLLFDGSSGPVKVQLRRGTASQWTTANPILSSGELGLETDTNLIKAGDGTSNWSQLSYLNPSASGATESYVDAAIATKVSRSGDTMTGALTLSGNPTSNLHASTKNYVDTAANAAVDAAVALAIALG